MPSGHNHCLFLICVSLCSSVATSLPRHGNVGIGTTNPGNYKLEVEENIGARDFSRMTGWNKRFSRQALDGRSLAQKRIQYFLLQSKVSRLSRR